MEEVVGGIIVTGRNSVAFGVATDGFNGVQAAGRMNRNKSKREENVQGPSFIPELEALLQARIVEQD